jgi:hypothetical protein
MIDFDAVLQIGHDCTVNGLAVVLGESDRDLAEAHHRQESWKRVNPHISSNSGIF